MTISLPPDLEQFTKRLVDSGRFASGSEVVLASLRLLEAQEADVPEPSDLRARIQEALAQGPPVRMTREELKAMARRRMAALRAEVAQGTRAEPTAADVSDG